MQVAGLSAKRQPVNISNASHCQPKELIATSSLLASPLHAYAHAHNQHLSTLNNHLPLLVWLPFPLLSQPVTTMDDRDQDRARKQRESGEREAARLWRAWRTVHEMVQDRGYELSDEEVKISFDDFKSQYAGSDGGVK